VSGDEALRMGLVNRMTEPGRALDGARALAHELADLPPRCMREDRLSSYEQWGVPIDEALQIELGHAQATLASGESLEGAIRFAQGAGRHGAAASATSDSPARPQS
jgi:enoyl-CoA hydratase